MELKKVDIKGGEITFGQKIELIKIAQSENDDVSKIKEMIFALGGNIGAITDSNAKEVFEYFEMINEGLIYWTNLEAEQLKYEPTVDEKKQGFSKINEMFGDFATIDSLAKDYNYTHDQVLELSYGIVFAILKKDLETHKITMRNHEREKLT